MKKSLLMFLGVASCLGAATILNSKSTEVIEFEVPGYPKTWSREVERLLDSGVMFELEAGIEDFKENFCPDYDEATRLEKKLAWGALIGAISRFESRNNPRSVYREPDNSLSEGLFQLTYGNRYCPRSKQEGDLHDPIVNINCALRLMGHFVRRDRVVTSGGVQNPRGLARYWSVVRVPDRRRVHHLIDITRIVLRSPGCL